MKKIYTILFLLVVSILTTKTNFAQCNKPFISEIIFSKDSTSISGISNIPNSFAVEIFNPKNEYISLTGYYIKLIDKRNIETIINLSGQIDAKGKFVVAFSESDNTLLNISNFITSQLNYDEKISLHFGKDNELLDKIGNPTLNSADSINIAAALADPINYLNSININLTSLKNFTFRRNPTVTSGDPNFTNVAQNWNPAPNGDISNVGQFMNICSQTIQEKTVTLKNESIHETIDSNSNRFLEWDVLIKASDDSTFLNSAFLKIKYPVSLFGASISNILVTPLDSFVTGYTTNSVYFVNADSTIRIQYNINNSGNPSRVNLTTTFQRIMHIRWNITNHCNQIGLFFFSQPQHNDVTFQYSSTEPIFGNSPKPYINKVFPSNLNINFCQANITDFSPSEIRAGVGDTLTIKGYNFVPTASQISFKNSFNGGATYTRKCNNHDYIVKNDTTIKIIMPSVIFAIDTVDTFPGSGKIKLFDGFNNIFSQTELKVKYAISNDVANNNGIRKFEKTLQKFDTSAYIFHIDSASVNTILGAREAIERAIEEWRCHTHVNFRLGADVNNTSYNVNDNVNTIFFVDANNNNQLFSTMLTNGNSGRTGQRRDTCPTLNSLVREIDIAFIKDPHLLNNSLLGWNTNFNIGVPNPQYTIDFYQNILHEIGHAHTLDHVIDTLELMHYSTNPFIEIPYYLRKNLNNTQYATEAGEYAVNMASSASVGCGTIPMTSQNSSICTNQIFENSSIILPKVYPNPTFDKVTFEFENITNCYLKIYNSLGEELKIIKVESRLVVVDLFEFPRGLYFINTIVNKDTKVVKVVKL
jgi:hypothetical protein